MPTTYLLMLHPHPPVVAASHSLFCAILNLVDEVSSCSGALTIADWLANSAPRLRKRFGGIKKDACDPAQPHSMSAACDLRQIGCVQKQQLAPFYVRRALEGYPARTPLNALTTGMDALARSLPAGSPMVLLCLQRIAAHCLQMLRTGREEDLQPALDLVHLLGYLLLVMDVQVVFGVALVQRAFSNCVDSVFVAS